MCLKWFKKKEEIDPYLEDRKCILLAAQEMDILIALDDKQLYRTEILEIKDELLYISPRKNPVVFSIDKKIREKISDVRLILNGSNIDEDEVLNCLKNIKILIKERNAKELN